MSDELDMYALTILSTGHDIALYNVCTDISIWYLN